MQFERDFVSSLLAVCLLFGASLAWIHVSCRADSIDVQVFFFRPHMTFSPFSLMDLITLLSSACQKTMT